MKLKAITITEGTASNSYIINPFTAQRLERAVLIQISVLIIQYTWYDIEHYQGVYHDYQGYQGHGRILCGEFSKELFTSKFNIEGEGDGPY